MAKKGTGFVPCTACGGSGARDTTEIVYNPKTKQNEVKKVRVVCTTCGGRGGFHV
jgi:YgiT-type zinc finger domain-containing protein